MAIDLETGTSGDITQAPSDQNNYVTLAQLAQESPRDAVLEGWNEVSRLLQLVCDLHGIQREGGNLGLLNSLERRKLLDFHAYALLRDMNAFSVDAMATAPSHIAPPVAQDYAVAVRGAKRLLHRLAAGALYRVGS